MTSRDLLTVHPSARPTPSEQAASLATWVLTQAPCGGLTLVNRRALATFGGEAAFARALVEATNELERDLLDVHLAPHRREGMFEYLVGEFISTTLDRDTDLDTCAPEWGDETQPYFEPDGLSGCLSPFGSASIPGLARVLAVDGHMRGDLTVLVTDPACARPYRGILDRQESIADPVARQVAQAATFDWLATDFATFAAERRHAATVVVADDRDAEWHLLAAHAIAVAPSSASPTVSS